jgi:Na+/proline symporter
MEIGLAQMRSTLIKVAIGLVLIGALVAARFPVRRAMAWDAEQLRQIVLAAGVIVLAVAIAAGVLMLLFPRQFRRGRRRR